MLAFHTPARFTFRLDEQQSSRPLLLLLLLLFSVHLCPREALQVTHLCSDGLETVWNREAPQVNFIRRR
ncbi:hypothetical protein MHYP_G00000770 [Metynnis hypsauchen]